MELALNEKQIPQFVGNNRKRKQDMEGLERDTLLAKQVLSQAELHAHKRSPFHSKAFAPIPKSVPSHFH